MRKTIAATLAGALLLGACATDREPRSQSTLNEASTTTGTGNTGAAGTAAAGASVNSQSSKEAARDAERR